MKRILVAVLLVLALATAASAEIQACSYSGNIGKYWFVWIGCSW